MTTYTIRTDADMTTIDAANMDAAARQWAADEGYRGVLTAGDLLRRIARIGDGAWMWIEGPEGRAGGSTAEAMCGYLDSERS